MTYRTCFPLRSTYQSCRSNGFYFRDRWPAARAGSGRPAVPKNAAAIGRGTPGGAVFPTSRPVATCLRSPELCTVTTAVMSSSVQSSALPLAHQRVVEDVPQRRHPRRLVPDFGIVLGCLAGMKLLPRRHALARRLWACCSAGRWAGGNTLKMPCLPRYSSGTGQSEPARPLAHAGRARRGRRSSGRSAATPTLGAPAGELDAGDCEPPIAECAPDVDPAMPRIVSVT